MAVRCSKGWIMTEAVVPSFIAWTLDERDGSIEAYM